MVGKKRPVDGGDATVKGSKHSSDARASKRQRKSEKPSAHYTAKSLKSASVPQEPVTKPAKSVLKLDEKSFPRGGGSVLTPLEHKQIQNEAARDVLFEQSSGKQAPNETLSDEESYAHPNELTRPSKIRRKGKAGEKSVEASGERRAERVEGLSYRRLVPGSVVLGQIAQITSRDIALALPNNLTGYIPLAAISEQFTKRVEKLLAADEVAGQEQDEDEFEDIDLKKLFSTGQYLRAYVTSNGDIGGVKSKRRIELSIMPQLANHGISPSDIVVNCMLQAAVVSVEDHGLVMDLGLEDSKIKGFISVKELGQGIELNQVEEGAVLLCLVTSTSGNSRTVKLSSDLRKAGNATTHLLKTAPSINAFAPGVAVEMLITDVATSDIRGNVMGMLDVTADHFHSGYPTSTEELNEKYKVGSKIKARILFTLPKDDTQRAGVSILDGILSFSRGQKSAEKEISPLQKLSISSFVEDATVIKVESKLGLFMDVGVPHFPAFAHISHLSDKKVESLSPTTGAYKIGTKHRARITGYNPMDGLFLVSLEQHVLDQPFLRIEDIKIGQVVKGTVDRLVINERGVGGVLINLAEGITGLASEMHMADVHLQHPERKFREGMTVTARVLSTDPERRQIRLTLKKSLVNSDVEPWTNYEQISVGDQSPGTIVNLLREGASVQFYGNVRGFLPVAEMSEAFIKDPSEHFRVGQTVNVNVLRLDKEQGKMTVSCKDQSNFGQDQQDAFNNLVVGQIVGATVNEVSTDIVRLELEAGIKAILRVTQLNDGSEEKNMSTLKKIRVGQKLSDCLVLEKDHRQHSVFLSKKPSLLKASRNGSLITSFAQAEVGKKVDGFVRSVSGDNIFVQFAGGLIGLLHRSQLPEEISAKSHFGLQPGQSISASISMIKPDQQRFFLTMKEDAVPVTRPSTVDEAALSRTITNPVDGVSTSLSDFTMGKITRARIRSVKRTQLNVSLADNVHARIDISEAFSSWEDIKDPQNPLQQFKSGDIIPVRILGVHSPRDHKFLPITHRVTNRTVFELSARKSDLPEGEADILTIDTVDVGQEYIVFINNHGPHHVWVNLRPNVRGTINLIDLTSDISLLSDVTKNFPLGFALKAAVKSVEDGKLSLTAVPASDSLPLSLEGLSKGMIIPGRVKVVINAGVVVQISRDIEGIVRNTDIADDYDEVKGLKESYQKNDIIQVCVVDVNASRKKLLLSTRPSLVLSSTLPVKDRRILSVKQLKVNDIVRGYVKSIADVGIIVDLSPTITAFTKVANLSDAYIKDWKKEFELDQLVKGKIIAVDHATDRVSISLKASHIENDYVPQITWNDVKVGQIVTGKIRKIEDYGVFIVVDNSTNVSGLCHKNDIADQKVEDVKKLFEEGDKVKAYVRKVDSANKKLGFSLKASYFKDEDKEDHELDDGEDVEMEDIATSDDDEGDVDLHNVRNLNEDEEAQVLNEEAEPVIEHNGNADKNRKPASGLTTSSFDWDGGLADDVDSEYQTETEEQPMKKKKRRKPEIQIDRTGDLDKYGPQSVADFERQLLGQPNSSALWIRYMAFQLELNEVEKARAIADRALRTINMLEEEEKLNVWIALLNLENSFGSDETLDAVYTRALQYVDKSELHERLASIYIDSGKHDKAEDLFQRMTKIKDITATLGFWLNYAAFLMTTMNKPDDARKLLQRAMQSVHQLEHVQLTAKFGALEFHSPNGDAERGRTIFEGLLSTFPKRWDLWDQFVDLERAKGDTENVRALFERMAGAKMKPRRAKCVFKRWLDFEEKEGDKKQVEKVNAAARDYVEKARS